ncbi:MAG TPA: hypothetical protein VGI87_11915 [Solirubrobacteraceae bacterium]
MIAQNPARAVYGTIVCGALLAAESAHQESYPETVSSVVLALIVYWLAHTYSDIAGERLAHRVLLTFRELRRSAFSELPILIGGALPLAVLIVMWIVGATLTTGLTWAVYSCAAAIVIVEISAGVATRLRGWQLAGQIGFGALLGVLVIALKILLH